MASLSDLCTIVHANRLLLLLWFPSCKTCIQIQLASLAGWLRPFVTKSFELLSWEKKINIRHGCW